MNTTDPKHDFLTFLSAYADELRKQAPQPWFRQSCNVALAQLAHNGATAEELTGVRRFVKILCNLAEQEVEPVRLPVKSLDDIPEPKAK